MGQSKDKCFLIQILNICSKKPIDMKYFPTAMRLCIVLTVSARLCGLATLGTTVLLAMVAMVLGIPKLTFIIGFAMFASMLVLRTQSLHSAKAQTNSLMNYFLVTGLPAKHSDTNSNVICNSIGVCKNVGTLHRVFSGQIRYFSSSCYPLNRV